MLSEVACHSATIHETTDVNRDSSNSTILLVKPLLLTGDAAFASLASAITVRFVSRQLCVLLSSSEKGLMSNG